MKQLLVDSARQKSAVHSQNLARHETRRVRGQKNRSSRQLFDFAETLHGRARQELAPAISLVKEFLVQRRAKDSGRDGVNIDAARRPFESERFRERGNGSFARRVGGDFVERDKG